jgi:Lipocalin-like domain
MNKFKLFTAVIALSLLSACSSDPLIGKWSLSDINYDAVIKTLPADKQVSAREEIARNKKEIVGKNILEFLKDGKAVSTQPAQGDMSKLESKKGTWKLSKDKKSIELKLEGEPQATSLKIVKNTSKELVLEPIAPAGQDLGPAVQITFEKK